MQEQDFFIFSEFELAADDVPGRFYEQADDKLHWLMIQEKKEFVVYRITNQKRHGLGTIIWNQLVLLQKGVLPYGVTVYLGFYEKTTRLTLINRIDELVRMRIRCACVEGCIRGDYENCRFEPGGMTFFPRDFLKTYQQTEEGQRIVRLEPKAREPEQIYLF